MVCMGNICRSPMAAAVLTELVGRSGLVDVEVESFGTTDYHVGEPADRRAEAALQRAGWRAPDHRARQIGPAELAAADLVLCMDRRNLAALRGLGDAGAHPAHVHLLRTFDPTSVPGDDEVPDPWSGGDADFDRALQLIERACRGVVGQLAAAGR